MTRTLLVAATALFMICGCSEDEIGPSVVMSANAESPNPQTPASAQLSFESRKPEPDCLDACDFVDVPANVRITRDGQVVLERKDEATWTATLADPLAGSFDIRADLPGDDDQSGKLTFPPAFTVTVARQAGGAVLVKWTNPWTGRLVIDVADSSSRVSAHYGDDDGEELISSGMEFDRVIVTKQLPITGSIVGDAKLGISEIVPPS